VGQNEILNVKHLKTHFFTDEGVVRAVDDVSFTIRKGEALGLVGESGCGKSMTALSILRLVPNPPGKIVGGEILLRGRDLLTLEEKEMRSIRGKEISMIFQEPSTSMNPSFTIGNQMKEVMRYHQRKANNHIDKQVVDILKAVRIPDPDRVLSQYPHQMSGGMLQRVMIAMAISCEPSLLICDEPTTALDVSTQAQIIDLLRLLKAKRETSLLFITHDLGVLSWICDTAAVMYAGTIVEYSDIHTILLNPWHPYTKALIGSTPRLDQDADQLRVIRGQVPNLAHLPSGCRFHPRCEMAQEICRGEAPRLEERDPGHLIACYFA